MFHPAPKQGRLQALRHGHLVPRQDAAALQVVQGLQEIFTCPLFSREAVEMRDEIREAALKMRQVPGARAPVVHVEALGTGRREAGGS